MAGGDYDGGAFLGEQAGGGAAHAAGTAGNQCNLAGESHGADLLVGTMVAGS